MLTIKNIMPPFVYADGEGKALQIHFKDIEGNIKIGSNLVKLKDEKYVISVIDIIPTDGECEV